MLCRQRARGTGCARLSVVRTYPAVTAVALIRRRRKKIAHSRRVVLALGDVNACVRVSSYRLRVSGRFGREDGTSKSPRRVADGNNDNTHSLAQCLTPWRTSSNPPKARPHDCIIVSRVSPCLRPPPPRAARWSAPDPSTSVAPQTVGTCIAAAARLLLVPLVAALR